MQHTPLTHASLRLSNKGTIEIFLGLIIIAISAVLPAFSINNIFTQLIALLIIPLLRFHYPVAVLPLGVITFLWINGFSNHLLLSGFLIYLSIEYAVAAGRWILAAVIACQWLILAYVITATERFTADDAPALLVEFLFILLAATIGQFRLKNSHDRQRTHQAQQHLKQELRSGLARYLHDSVARSLTIMSMQATTTELGTTDPETRRKLRLIANTGRSAINDLHELVDHLIDTNPQDGSAMLGLWHTASIGDTIENATYLLKEAGYTVTSTNIDSSQRLPRTTETAFALAFNEATANLVKHSPPGGPVSISVDTHDQLIDVEITNSYENTSSHRTGVGLTTMSTRMNDIGGHTNITTTTQSWQVTLSFPLTHD